MNRPVGSKGMPSDGSIEFSGSGLQGFFDRLA